ncbi:Rhodanese-related sulfurtransferase [Pseudovibrio sp. Tun.PSC04-5.I4]|nr:Rhodanese-related sulfurtransferase [Pseudovibrio sp. Tun.PSC04-5.I4]
MEVSMHEAYAGDRSVTDVFESLKAESSAALVDVRTNAEWTFVGIPDLSALSKEVMLAEWHGFPSNGPHEGFTMQLSDALKQKGLDQSAAIYFLCRSGVRSKAAAIAMTTLGYKNCYNVAEGFEGSHDAEGHRGSVSGWKAEGLPWSQG